MIIVDSKELNLSVEPPTKESTPEQIAKWNALSNNEQWVINSFVELRKNKKVRLVDQTKMDLYRMLQAAPTSFDVSGTRVNPNTGVTERWLYTKQRPLISKTGEKTFVAHRISFFESIEYDTSKSVDLVFFLLNIVDVRQFGLFIENKEEEARKEIEATRAKSSVENWIYNKFSDKDIIDLAYRWKLSDVPDKTPTELRLGIVKYLEAGDLRKDKAINFQKFLDELDSNTEIIKIGSLFNKAVSEGTIAFNSMNRTCIWTGDNKQIGGTIPPERFGHDKEEYIITFLVNNENEKEFFLKSIPTEREVSQEPQVNPLEQVVNKPSGDVKLPDEIEAKLKELDSLTHAASIKKWGKENCEGLEIGLIPVAEGKLKLRKYFEDKQNATVVP